TDQAVEFISRPRAKPFLVVLSHKAVHAPFIPAERHANLFADMPIVRAPSAQDSLVGKPVLRRPGIKLSPSDPDVHSSDEMIRYPKLVEPGASVEPFALSIDLAPTILELAGVSLPDTIQGRSLLPLLKGDTTNAPSSFLAEFFLGNGTNRFPTWQAVRTQRWK